MEGANICNPTATKIIPKIISTALKNQSEGNPRKPVACPPPALGVPAGGLDVALGSGIPGSAPLGAATVPPPSALPELDGQRSEKGVDPGRFGTGVMLGVAGVEPNCGLKSSGADVIPPNIPPCTYSVIVPS
jgi:hypothetical protein